MTTNKENLKTLFPQINLKKIFELLKKNKLFIPTYHYASIEKNSENLVIYFHSKEAQDHIKNNTGKFIYIARKGLKFDGHSLSKEILDSENYFVGEAEPIRRLFHSTSEQILKHKNFIGVENCELALNAILEETFQLIPDNFLTIAVTGTNGKTSVTQLVSNLLSRLSKEKILKIGTLGVQLNTQTLPVSHVTTPDYPSFLSILDLAKKNQIKTVVLEATSHGLKEKRLGNWTVNIAIFTNLTQDHLDYHKTMDDYRISKQKLFNSYLVKKGFAIINTNNDEYKNFIEAAKDREINLIIVGNSKNHSEIKKKYIDHFLSIQFLYIENASSNLTGLAGSLILINSNLEIKEASSFQCPLIGDFQFENILCAASVCIAQNFKLKEICLALSSVECIPGRLEIVKPLQSKPAATVIVDYAHTPDALEKAIFTCKKTLDSKGKLITVFGCGGDRDPTKRPLMGNIAFQQSDVVIVTSDNPRTEDPEKIINNIFSEVKPNDKWLREADRKLAIQKALMLSTKNDIILIAGKGHEDYQIIGTTKYPFSDVDVVRSLL